MQAGVMIQDIGTQPTQVGKRLGSSLPSRDTMRRARAEKDKSFDGVFYVAVKTTGIFCRPTCPARTPLEKNVEYFASPQDALLAGYRPCKRCRPLDRILKSPEWVVRAMNLVDEAEDRRATNKALRAQGLSPERLRRYFKQHYGMTFQAFARGRRLGQAFGKLREGQDVMETAMDHGFESSSGFREAFRRVFGDPPSKAADKSALMMRWLDTPLGAMVAVASEEALCLLEFADRRMMETQLRVLMARLKCVILPGQNDVLRQAEKELEDYFEGRMRSFTVPLSYPGTPFQVAAWERLLRIPYGEILSYGQQAKDMGFPDAQRAVGKANGDNRLAIIIPCHRVVRSDGSLCGYGGGLWRKKRLLELEQGQSVLVG